jgi:hypothetical protein
MDTVIRQDGLDQLRAALAPLITLAYQQDRDIVDITLSIPDPVPLHPSILTRWFFTREVRKRYYYADSRRRVEPPLYQPRDLSMEEWSQDMRQRADRMLAQARLDPLSYFAEDELLENAPALETVSVAEAAALKGVSEQSIRDILRSDARRETSFPGAYFLGQGRRGEWRIPKAEVEAWTPRAYPRASEA